MREKNIQLLQKDIEHQLGHNVTTSGDCELLSKEIFATTSIVISSQSIRRFFGLVAYKGNFTKQTLNCLSVYCGYANWDEFCKKNQAKDIFQLFDSQEDSSTYTDTDYWEASEHLCERLMKNPNLVLETHQKLLEFPQARKFFLEHHPMRDLLATPYILFFQEYLKYNNSNEAKLFAYGFLFNAAYLSDNLELMDLYYHKIKSTPATENVFVLPAGRKYGIELLYADLQNDETLFQQTWQEMLMAKKRYKKASEKSVCSFEYMVLEELIYTNRTTEMEFLIENNTAQIYKDEDFVPQNRKVCHNEVWKILCTITWKKAGKHEKAKDQLSKIDLDKLNIGWKNYYSSSLLDIQSFYN